MYLCLSSFPLPSHLSLCKLSYRHDRLFGVCVCVVGRLGEENHEEFEQHVHRIGNPTGTKGRHINYIAYIFEKCIFWNLFSMYYRGQSQSRKSSRKNGTRWEPMNQVTSQFVLYYRLLLHLSVCVFVHCRMFTHRRLASTQKPWAV